MNQEKMRAEREESVKNMEEQTNVLQQEHDEIIGPQTPKQVLS